MLEEEVLDEVSCLTVVLRIHGHLAEEVLHVGALDDERSETVPKVIESEKRLCTSLTALILRSYEASSELDCVWEIFLDELLCEMEHMSCCQERLVVLVELDVSTKNITISSKNLLSFRIPHDELLVWVLHSVEFVDIHLETASAAGVAECDLTQTRDLPHYVWRVVVVDHVDLVFALIRVSELFRWSQLCLKQVYADGSNNWFHGKILKFVHVFSYFLCPFMVCLRPVKAAYGYRLAYSDLIFPSLALVHLVWKEHHCKIEFQS